jgi:hypothetical protein
VNSLSNAMALANAASAFIVLYFMQGATKGAGFKSRVALLQGVQRVLYFALAGALMANAKHIFDTHELPETFDAAVDLAFFALAATSFLRHRTAPAVPDDASWSHPAPRVIYEPQPKPKASAPNGHYAPH